MPDYTILSQRQEGLRRFTCTSSGQFVLHDFSLGESTRLALDEKEMRTLLAALPPYLLLETLAEFHPQTLGADNLFLALDDPPLPQAALPPELQRRVNTSGLADVRAELRRLRDQREGA